VQRWRHMSRLRRNPRTLLQAKTDRDWRYHAPEPQMRRMTPSIEMPEPSTSLDSERKNSSRLTSSESEIFTELPGSFEDNESGKYWQSELPRSSSDQGQNVPGAGPNPEVLRQARVLEYPCM
jgi:hypothetical protein